MANWTELIDLTKKRDAIEKAFSGNTTEKWVGQGLKFDNLATISYHTSFEQRHVHWTFLTSL